MLNDFDSLAFPVARLALAYLLHSTVLLGGTWVLLRVARVRSWALRERMWKTALILPLLTAAIPLPAAWSRPSAPLGFELMLPKSGTEAGVEPVVQLENEAIVVVRLSADHAKSLDMHDAAGPAAGPLASADEGPLSAVPMSEPRQTTKSQTLAPEPTAVPASVGVTAIRGICYGVLTFFVLGSLHVIRRTLVFARSLRDCQPIVDASICVVLANVLHKTHVRHRVRLLMSAADRPPAAFGIFRWTIVLPQALIPTLKPDELRALLGHEVGHLARGDALWLWIGRILCACCAFQPLNFLARRQLRLAAEFLSDEWAVRNSANRFALARCLTRVAEWSAHLAPQSLELAALGPRSNLTERVERLVLERCPADAWAGDRRRSLVWAAAFAVAFGLECSAPRTSLLAEPPKDAPSGAIAETQPAIQPDTKPTLDDALQSLSEETRDLLSELKHVDRLLKQSIPSDSAIEIITGRLEWRAARLAETQVHLTHHRERASKPAHTGTVELHGPSDSRK